MKLFKQLTLLEGKFNLFYYIIFFYIFFIIFIVLLLSNINYSWFDIFDILKHSILIKHGIECFSIDVMLSTQCIIQPR